MSSFYGKLCTCNFLFVVVRSKELTSPWILLRQPCVRLEQWLFFPVCCVPWHFQCLPVEDKCQLPLLSALHSCSSVMERGRWASPTPKWNLVMKATHLFWVLFIYFFRKEACVTWKMSWSWKSTPLLPHVHLKLFCLLGQRLSCFPEAVYKMWTW